MIKRLLLAFLAFVLLYAAFEWYRFPDVTELAKEPPKTTAFMEQRKGELREAGKDDTLKYKWVPYERISRNLRRAVLVAEDNDFYEHEGVDVKAMRDAFEKNLEKRRIAGGGSTITQQLAKNLYLSPSKNPVRKIREYLIARSLEQHLSKKRILELYLNVVEFGERVYGAEAAARFYFKMSAASLSPKQAALLAGCLPNPRVMNPAHPNRRLRARQQMILRRMRRWGVFLEREVLTAKKPDEAPPVNTDTATATDTTATEVETTTGSDTTATEPEETTTDVPAVETTTETAAPPETTTTGGTAASPPGF